MWHDLRRLGVVPFLEEGGDFARSQVGYDKGERGVPLVVCNLGELPFGFAGIARGKGFADGKNTHLVQGSGGLG